MPMGNLITAETAHYLLWSNLFNNLRTMVICGLVAWLAYELIKWKRDNRK